MSEYPSQQLLQWRSALHPLYNFRMCGGEEEQDIEVRPNLVKEMRTLVYEAVVP